MKRMVLIGAGLLLLGLAAAGPSIAQSPHEERMHRLHVQCERGDRRACVQFGVMIGELRERHQEWRRHHPDWWWWER